VPNSDPRESEELMGAYVAGDLAAFDELYRRVAPRVYGYLLRLTRQPERADDLLQITFSKAHRARHAFIVGAPVAPWLLAIARRAFLDDARRRRSQREELTHAGEVPEPPSEGDERADDVSTALHEALQQLPANYREAIELTKFAGLSAAEAGLVLGASESAVKLRVHRGYEQLRKVLGEPEPNSGRREP
jgi:RNA polymerase sigma factor (sigma-70 family)